MAPAVLSLRSQQAEGDCMLTSLSIVLGVPYLDVHEAATALFKSPHTTGLTVREAIRLAKRLGHPLSQHKFSPTIDFSSSVGILTCKINKTYHAVVVYRGMVFDPTDATLADIATYVKVNKAKPAWYLVA